MRVLSNMVIRKTLIQEVFEGLSEDCESWVASKKEEFFDLSNWRTQGWNYRSFVDVDQQTENYYDFMIIAQNSTNDFLSLSFFSEDDDDDEED